MSGGVPDDEQLRRIERGVLDRIGRPRRVAQRIAGATAGVAALALVVGGVAVLSTRGAGAGGGSAASGSGAGSSADRSSALVVTCHGRDAVVQAKVDPARLPASALEGCGTALTGQAARPSGTAAGGGTEGSPSPAATGVVCRSTAGDVDVYPGRTACPAPDATPIPG